MSLDDSSGDFDAAVARFHAGMREFLNGNPALIKEQFSHRDDVSIANPYGPPVRGWRQVAETIERAAALRRDGELVGVETITTYVMDNLGYVVEIERAKAKIGAREDITPYALRATNIFRREEGVWKMIHRHADPITTAQPAESVLHP